jgi:hypothetical protein
MDLSFLADAETPKRPDQTGTPVHVSHCHDSNSNGEDPTGATRLQAPSPSHHSKPYAIARFPPTAPANSPIGPHQPPQSAHTHNFSRSISDSWCCPCPMSLSLAPQKGDVSFVQHPKRDHDAAGSGWGRYTGGGGPRLVHVGAWADSCRPGWAAVGFDDCEDAAYDEAGKRNVSFGLLKAAKAWAVPLDAHLRLHAIQWGKLAPPFSAARWGTGPMALMLWLHLVT